MIRPRGAIEVELTRAKIEIDRLRRLTPYVRHLPRCTRAFDNGWLCSCGLDDLIR